MIIDQLTEIYLIKEKWHKHKLSKEESDEYHERLLVQGNIITYVRNGELLGYLEFWRINFEQLGRVICNREFFVFEEDILNGNIAYIANMWINPEDRNGVIFDMLSAMFLSRNKDAELFCAFKIIKHNRPFQVYTRQELIKLYNKGV